MTSLRTPEQRLADWTRHAEAFGKPSDEARRIAIEALTQIASGLPRVQPIKRGAKARDIARTALTAQGRFDPEPRAGAGK
jgi:hypothetical protein